MQVGSAEAVNGPFPAPRNGQPVFVALVATHGSADYIELVRNGLAAALEALPPNVLVGIITLSDTVRLPLVIAISTEVP